MAAATSSNRTSNDSHDVSTKNKLRIRTPFDLVDDRLQRNTRQQRRTTSAVMAKAVSLSPLYGATLDIDAIRPIIYAGQTISPHHLRVYESFINHPLFPTLTPLRDEVIANYITRMLRSLAVTYTAPYNVEFENVRTNNNKADDILGVHITANDPDYIDIESIDSSIAKHNRALAANLFDNFANASEYIGDFASPLLAIVCNEINMGGDTEAWIYKMQCEIAENEEEVDQIGLAQIRKYIRTNKTMTPGATRNLIGAHHVRLYKSRTRMNAKAIETAINGLPTTEQDVAMIIYTVTNKLRVISTKLKNRQTAFDDVVFHSQDDKSFPTPRVILGNKWVSEIIDDYYAESQGECFGMNYAFAIDRIKTDPATTFFSIMDDFQTSHELITTACNTITEYASEEQDDL